MIKIEGNDLWRGGQKIGWIEGHHIWSHDKKLGYFDDHYVYNEEAHKLAYIDGDYLKDYEGNTKASLEYISQNIEGGVLDEIAKCAIYVLLGD